MYFLGKISRTHGYNGTVVLVSEQELDDELENLREIFVMIDGLPVPFPVKEMELQTGTSARIRLEFVGSKDEALRLAGCEAYTEIDLKKQDTEAGQESWIGFAVNDAVYGNIGTIRRIDDYKGNIVLQVMDGRKETLISLYPGLVTRIDHQAGVLHITAPEGYF